MDDPQGAVQENEDAPRHKSKKERKQLKKQKKLQLQQGIHAPEKMDQPQEIIEVADGKEQQNHIQPQKSPSRRKTVR